MSSLLKIHLVVLEIMNRPFIDFSVYCTERFWTTAEALKSDPSLKLQCNKMEWLLCLGGTAWGWEAGATIAGADPNPRPITIHSWTCLGMFTENPYLRREASRYFLVTVTREQSNPLRLVLLCQDFRTCTCFGLNLKFLLEFMGRTFKGLNNKIKEVWGRSDITRGCVTSPHQWRVCHLHSKLSQAISACLK